MSTSVDKTKPQEQHDKIAELEAQIRRYLITGKKEAPKVTRTSPNVK